MRRILLDTSAYSGLQRGEARIAQLVQEADAACVNPVVLGELRAGFAAGSRRDQNEESLRLFLRSARVDVVDLDQETSVFYAAIHSTLRRNGTPIPSNDMWIAASAMQHGLILLTTDSHFGKVASIIVEMVER